MAKQLLILLTVAVIAASLVCIADAKRGGGRRGRKTVDYRVDDQCRSDNSFHSNGGNSTQTNNRRDIRQTRERNTDCACHEDNWNRCVTKEGRRPRQADPEASDPIQYERNENCTRRNSFHGRGRRRTLLTSEGERGNGECVCHEESWTRCEYEEAQASTTDAGTTVETTGSPDPDVTSDNPTDDDTTVISEGTTDEVETVASTDTTSATAGNEVDIDDDDDDDDEDSLEM